MRYVAIFFNVVLIGTVVYLVGVQSSVSGKDLALAALFLTAPISSLIAFYMQGAESWLSLYFKRKTLEEKKKIQDLNDT